MPKGKAAPPFESVTVDMWRDTFIVRVDPCMYGPAAREVQRSFIQSAIQEALASPSRESIERFCRETLGMTSETVTNGVMLRVVIEAIQKWEGCFPAAPGEEEEREANNA